MEDVTVPVHRKSVTLLGAIFVVISVANPAAIPASLCYAGAADPRGDTGSFFVVQQGGPEGVGGDAGARGASRGEEPRNEEADPAPVGEDEAKRESVSGKSGVEGKGARKSPLKKIILGTVIAAALAAAAVFFFSRRKEEGGGEEAVPGPAKQSARPRQFEE
ncbi:hypothetical protein CSUI_004509 [Cystoisospora suis]|uniref:Transmembrane protein n=1 Tax=Cystoisospora suis TaxID=483139 RepID=A0A2C6KBB2_9APIC|nr:hypothetical protein CSUI_004509 [Cystoisospora suis]